jgi:two-component system, LytTR family, response regulator
MREKKLDCIIVEDEVASQKVLAGFLALACPHVRIIGVASSVKDAKDLIDAKMPDFIILDIRLKDKTGFDLLALYPDRGFNVVIMTAHSEFDYAKTAISYGVNDYLLKPVKIDDLRTAINKIESKHTERLNQSLAITPLYSDTILIPYKDILMLSADGAYTQISLLSSEKYLLSRSLSHYEKQLPHPLFFRCHDSYIVNSTYILSMQISNRSGYLNLVGSINCLVSSRKLRPLAKLLKERK